MARESEFNPAGVAPIEVQPYQPVAGPEVTPPAPSPLPTRPPEVNGAVKTSGAIATMADGILRGFMQGRAFGEARKVMRLKAQADNLQNSYNQDASLLYNMKAQGVDPNSAEYKRALSAVQGSWGALMTFYGQHIQPEETGKKKSRLKRVEGGIASAFESKDPMEVSRAWYQIAQKVGPPVLSQVAALDTPEAQAQRKIRTAATQGELTETQAADKLATLRNNLLTLEASPVPNDPQQAQQRDAKIDEARTALIETQEALNPALGMRQFKRYKKAPDGTTLEYEVDAEGNEIPNSERPLSASAGGPPKPPVYDGKTDTIKYQGKVYSPDDVAALDSTNPELASQLRDMFDGARRILSTKGTTTISDTTHLVPQGNQLVPMTFQNITRHAGGSALPALPWAGGTHRSTVPTSENTPLLRGYGKHPEDEPREEAFSRNRQWAKPGPYVTKLSPEDEKEFQAWAAKHPDLVEGELDTPTPDYDVRGRWLAEKNGDPDAKLVRNAFDGKLHASDKWKTPYDAVFSRESIYAKPDAPRWDGDKLVADNGQVIVDETPSPRRGASPASPPAHAAKPAARASSPAPRGAGVVSEGNAPVGFKYSPQTTDMMKKYDAAAGAQTAMKQEFQEARHELADIQKDPTNGAATMGLVASYLKNVIGAHSAAQQGAQVRLTNVEWQMALQSAPWLKRFASHVQGGVLLSGVTLDPGQARNMVGQIGEKAVLAKKTADDLKVQLDDSLANDKKGIKSGNTPSFDWNAHPVAQ